MLLTNILLSVIIGVENKSTKEIAYINEELNK